MKIFTIKTLLTILTISAFGSTILSISALAGARGTGYNTTKTVNGRECIYFYDHNNNLVSVSCLC